MWEQPPIQRQCEQTSLTVSLTSQEGNTLPFPILKTIEQFHWVLLFHLACPRHFERIKKWHAGWPTPWSVLDSHPPPGGNSALGTPSTSSFQSCGDFACYTAVWQEKQALGFIRVRGSIFSPRPSHLEVIIICELIIWLACDIRLVGGGCTIAAETERK